MRTREQVLEAGGGQRVEERSITPEDLHGIITEGKLTGPMRALVELQDRVAETAAKEGKAATEDLLGLGALRHDLASSAIDLSRTRDEELAVVDQEQGGQVRSPLALSTLGSEAMRLAVQAEQESEAPVDELVDPEIAMDLATEAAEDESRL